MAAGVHKIREKCCSNTKFDSIYVFVQFPSFNVLVSDFGETLVQICHGIIPCLGRRKSNHGGQKG